jgi:hypothetical protein
MLWVNPAGLAAVPEASLMAEFVFHDPDPNGFRVTQWSAGFNARGFAFGYQRDRLVSGSANEVFRVGAARNFIRGSVGLSASLYRSDVSGRAVDIGVRYLLMPTVEVGATVRDLGQPEVRNAKRPASAALGVSWGLWRGALAISAEAEGQNRIDASGYDLSYRTGGQIAVPYRIPISAFVVVALNSDVEINRWVIGLSVGGGRRAVAVTTLQDNAPDLWSLALVASDRFDSRRSR